MFLDQIVATKKKEVAKLTEQFHQSQVEAVIAELPPCLGFENALKNSRIRSMGLIAEVKKASPSKGLIRRAFYHTDIAISYENAGADCISVLTDETYFKGSNDYLTDIRTTVNVPLLRKDFIIDHTQIFEARLLGADAILLIAAILTNEQLKGYHHIARGLGMDVLMEVHDEKELERALATDATMIGINNRNLHTFETDIRTTERLLQAIPKDKTIVSESGISSKDEIEYLASIGADAVLIGESFMRQEDIERAVQDLMGPASGHGIKA
ncbi:indole-3-glycerol phosphate synthase [Paenibacillus swuensis]|uniref:Indole-3-glycerol phosphate synthase n=1 Tax=Paenibacillus swuensis TaxID=1178515 RepID=A0A172TMF5_9BACL|nr:indole-3-glycerol phosphate synthase TrpC [Paenibacillus swuensis]ANE47963.1 indole-3-glycerol phosphate synthase [Paenibacillus swuensis]